MVITLMRYNVVVKFLRNLKNFFIPHHGNNYAPASLQKVAVLGMMLLVVLSFTAANLQALLWISSDWMVSTILPAVVVEETNEERADSNLVALKRNKTLDEAAQLKANDMAKHSYFSHNSPSGVTPWYWFEAADYNYVHAGENLAVHFSDSSELVEAWMDSPTHRANIMNGNYQEIGIGTAKGTYEGFDTVFVVQLFGTPAAAAPVVAAVTPTPPPTPVAVVPTPAIVAVAPPTTTPEVIAEEDPAEVEEVEEVEVNNDPVVAGAEVDEETEEDEVASSSSLTTPAILTSEPEVMEETKEVAVTDTGTVVYSSYVSTSTGGVPASIESVATGSNSGGIGGTTLPILSIATKPQLVLQYAYMIIGAFVLLALIISIMIEIRRQHPLQIAYSAGLVALMFLLFNLHLSLTNGVLIM